MRSFRKQLLAGIKASTSDSSAEPREFQVVTSQRMFSPKRILGAMAAPLNDRQIGEALPGTLQFVGCKSEIKPILPWLQRLPILGSRLLRQRTIYRFSFRRLPWHSVEMDGRVAAVTHAGKPILRSSDLESLACAA